MKQTIEAHSGHLIDLPAVTHKGSIDRPAEPLDSTRRAARAFVRALDQASFDLPDDIERRLAFARQLALQHVRVAARPAWDERDVTPWGQGASRLAFLRRWTHVLPALALLLGLMATSHLVEKRNVAAAAEIDTALLNDDLPPQAYADPGFVEFLKSGQGAEVEVITSETQSDSAPAE